MHVAVIGSGLPGLTAGACLAQAGHRVTLFEQVHRPGGVTAPYERHGYKWDLGQLIIEGLGPDEAAGLDRYWRDYVRFTRVMTHARRAERSSGWRAQVASLHSPAMAPPGHHAMTIYTIAPDRLREGDWASRKATYADALIACAERHIPGLRDHIQVCEVVTAADFRARTHLEHHAFGGIAPVMGSWSAPHQSPIERLWFVGAQSESGGGVNNVMPAAYRVAQRLAKMPAD